MIIGRPRVRVYVFTYRRSHLLRRALQSLLAQTYLDWICEVHNDDPLDESPKQLVAELNDPRLELVTHGQNYGPIKSFNQAFVGIGEQFLSILEDDNTWDTDFLSESISCLEARPEVSMVWSNMQLWKQLADGSTVATETLFWPQRDRWGILLPEVTVFKWPNSRSMLGGLHSNGAMLMRSQFASRSLIPTDCPFNFMEHVRERTFEYPIALLRKKLANWTWTLDTSRPSDLAQTFAVHVLLAETFLLQVFSVRSQVLRAWTRARRRKQRALLILFVAIMRNRRLWSLLRYGRVKDIVWILFDLFKHPLICAQGILRVGKFNELRSFLLHHTERLTSNASTPV